MCRVYRLCPSHVMLPILIEQDLDFRAQDAQDPIIKIIRGKLTALIDESDAVSEQLVVRLLRHRRLLVIFDGLSEMDGFLRERILPGNADFPINALLVTSRVEERLDKVHRTALKPIRVKGNRLSSFMEAYLTKRGKRGVFEDPEYFDLCRRLSLMVGDRDITVLLAKLFAEQMILMKEPSSDWELPTNIPDLMLSYLNQLNRCAEAGQPDNQTVHHASKLIAWECLKKNYRPSLVTQTEVSNSLRRENIPDGVKDYLENKLRILHLIGPGKDHLKFALDPLSEYLAGLHIIAENRGEDAFWRNFILEINKKAVETPDAMTGFILAVRDCCMAKGEEFGVPLYVEDELGKLMGISRNAPADTALIRESC